MAIYETKNPTKDGRKYFFRVKYKDIFGKTHDYSSEKFLKRKEAENAELIYKLKIMSNEEQNIKITVKQAFDLYLEEKRIRVKKQTILKNINMFNHFNFIFDIYINDLNYSHWKYIEKYFIDKKYSADYVNKSLGVLKQTIIFSNKNYNTKDTFLKFIVPFKNVNNIKKEMDFYTYEEYKLFDSAIDEFEYHVFFELLYYLGLRKGEAQALFFEDINFTNSTITIKKTLTTKIKGEDWTISTPKTRYSTRIIPLPKNVCNDLKIMYNNAKKYKDFKKDWFLFGNIKPFPETTITHKKNKYCDKVKLRRIRVHDFRHSCASLLINKGASIALVSKYLGHSNISITLNTYTHMYESELKNMTNILNDL